MSFLELFLTAVDTLRGNKLRAFLTTLGVVIGVLSVILLVGLFPEGVRTWDGTNQPLFSGIGMGCWFSQPFFRRNCSKFKRPGWSLRNAWTSAA